ncbi:MAG: cofactor-independent phosphoglycerate mutase [Promethearchaeota archaeon]
MKYAVLICDGAADWPIESLGNKTIFEVADTKSMDWIASHGKMGTLQTVPKGMHPGSEVGNMSIMGYRPEKDLTGRGALEALSANVPLNSTDIAFRCNLINIDKGLIKDYSSGHISTEEARPLIEMLQSQLKDEGVDFFPGVQYRHILRLDGNKFSENLVLTPPHDQLDKNYRNFLAKAKNSDDEKAKMTANYLNELIETSNKYLIGHEINKKRLNNGKLMATHVWPWGGGKKPNIESFKSKFGLKGAVISAVDLIFGIGIAAGLKAIRVKGATGLPDTNYKGKVEAALKFLKNNDYIYLHVEAADEMSHAGDIKRKISAVQDFDDLIVNSFIEAQKDFNDELVIAVLPDHPTPCKIRTHCGDPVPFAIYNPTQPFKSEKLRKFSEISGREGEYGHVPNGEQFMQILLS